MTGSINANLPENHHEMVLWQQCLEREYSLSELKALCWQLNIDPENLPHATKPELSIELVGYLQRHGRFNDLKKAHKIYYANRQSTLAAYRNWVLNETKYIELTGIPLPRWRDGRVHDPFVPLDKVYIQLQAIKEQDKQSQEASETEAIEAKAKEAHRGKTSRSPSDIMTGVRILGEYFYRRGQVYKTTARPKPNDPREVLDKFNRLVILGPPGSGKSTLLRFLARRFAENEQGLIPIQVSLRNFAISFAKDRSLNLREFALTQVASGNTELMLALEAAIEQSRVLWLLDSLDETQHLADEITKKASRLPGSLILTSRPISYNGSALRSLPHYEILPLTPEKADQFIYDWMTIFSKEHGEPHDTEIFVERLQAQLNNQSHLNTLMRNPLLLTFIVVLSSQTNIVNLPRLRTQLYARYIDQLQDWEIERQAQANISLESKFWLENLSGEEAKRVVRDGLNYIGWILHLRYYGGQNTEPPDANSVANKLAGYLAQQGYDNGAGVANAIIQFWQAAGMLDEWKLENHHYLSFRHLAFQEYAAAWGLQQAWKRDQATIWRFLKPRLHHPAWREPLLLWSNQAPEGLSRLVIRLQKGVSLDEHILHRDLLFATTMLGENPESDKKIVNKAVKRLVNLGRSNKYKRWLMPTILAIHLAILSLLSVSPKTSERAFAIALFVGMVISYSMIWLFLPPIYPRFQASLGLPLSRLVFTPSFSIYNAIQTLQSHIPLLPFLVKALRDRHWYVRTQAVQTLGNLNDKVAIPYLISALQDEDGNVRGAAAMALGQTKNKTTIPHLLTSLKDPDWFVRRATVEALGLIGEATTVPYLLAAIEDEVSEVRYKVTGALIEIGKPSIPYLLPALQSENKDIRSSCVSVLNRIGDASIVPYLGPITKDKDWFTRLVTIESLGNIGDETSLPYLLSALSDKDSHVRDKAIAAISKIGNTNIVCKLIKLLQDQNIEMRRAAATALKEIADSSTAPDLLLALQDKDSKVRQAAASALGKIGDESTIPNLITALQDQSYQVCVNAAEALVQIGSASVPHLVNQLQSKNKSLRRFATEALGQIGDIVAVPYLPPMLKDYDDIVRSHAAEALGKLGDSAAVPYLITALQDNYYIVRSYAIRSLGLLGDASVVPHIHTLLQDENFTVRSDVIKALEQIGDTACVPVLIEALEDKNGIIKERAAKSLIKLGNSSVVPYSYFIEDIQNQSTDWIRRSTAAKILGQIGDRNAVSYLICALQDESVYVRHSAVESLAQIGDPDITPHLFSALQDKEKFVRNAAFKALEFYASESTLPYIFAALQHSENIIHRTAANLLGNIATNCNDFRILQKIRRTLKQELNQTYQHSSSIVDPSYAETVRSSLNQVANRIVELNVANLTLIDPLEKMENRRYFKDWVHYGLWLSTIGTVAILTEAIANILSNELSTRLPNGLITFLVFFAALLLFIGINRKLEN